MTNLAKRKAQLQKRLHEIGDRLRRIEDHLEQPADPDWEENATASEMDEVLEGLEHAGSAEVQAIKAALQRLESGTYGVCTKCGTKIAEERLNVLPQTPFCQDCAHALQQKT